MALVGTGDVRVWLDLPDEDKEPNAKISSLIDAIEDFTESYCHRKFEAQLYKTNYDYCYLDGTGSSVMHLPVYPVWYVNEVAVDADRDFGNGTLVATDDIVLYEQEGKIKSDAGYFLKGRRNVRVEYYAGYAAGTHWSQDGGGIVQYPVPVDLKQTIIEMAAQSFKDGITAIHTVATQDEVRFIKLLGSNSVWRRTLNKYKDAAVVVGYGYDTP